MKVIMIYTHDKGYVCIYIYYYNELIYHIVLYPISPIQMSQQGIQPGHPEEHHMLMVPGCYFQLTSPRSSAGSISGRLSEHGECAVCFFFYMAPGDIKFYQ